MDLNHFFTAATAASVLTSYTITVAGGWTVEGLQYVAGNGVLYWQDGVGSSAFNSEDPPSNSEGAAFGTFVLDCDCTNPLSDQLAAYFGGIGAAAKESAPDWATISSTENGHEQEWRSHRSSGWMFHTTGIVLAPIPWVIGKGFGWW